MDACRTLVALAQELAAQSPVPSPRQFLRLLGARAAGIRSGPLALLDLRNAGKDRIPGKGFRREFDDATRGQARHFAGTARAVMFFGARATAWLSIHVRHDAAESADGRLGEAAIRFATLLLDEHVDVADAPGWLRSVLCMGNEINEIDEIRRDVGPGQCDADPSPLA